MTVDHSPTISPAARRASPPNLVSVLARSHRPVVGLGLIVIVIETVVGVTNAWPAQFGGSGDPASIATEWIQRGTVLSPPLFMIVGLALSLALLSLPGIRWLCRAGAILALAFGILGTVGSLGEFMAGPTPDVPRAAQDTALIGAAFSLAIGASAAAYLWRSFSRSVN